MLASLVSLAACDSTPRRAPTYAIDAPAYLPANATDPLVLPEEIQRVVVMPAYYPPEEASFLDAFDQAVSGELARTNLFEVQQVSREHLKNLTGASQLTVSLPLPPNLFAFLRKVYAADAVLFTDIIAYDPYRPLVVGLRHRLVTLDGTNRFLWAFEHTFNAGDARIAQAAIQFSDHRQFKPFPLDHGRTTLLSPRLFTEYAAAAAFSTLPPRQPAFIPAGKE